MDPAPVRLLDPCDPSPDTRVALDAWLSFQQALAWRPEDARRLLEAQGTPLGALRAAGGILLSPSALRLARERLQACGARVLPAGAPGYPEALALLPDAPPLLLVRGDVGALAPPCVAMVGSRAASTYGVAVAGALASCLARAGVSVVSGLAHGIDAVAHRAALDAGGRTVAVQACGPERVYPAVHRSLAKRIVAGGGAIVTEFPPGCPPRAAHFPLRNRVISGLARALVVVEARERSGSLVTAGHAATQGRTVFAVPGPLGVATSAGTNRLLRDGAQVLLSADDVLQEIGLRPGAARPASAPDAPRGDVRVLAALAAEPATRDELARRLRASPDALALALLELELAGAVAEDRDGRLRVVGPRRFASL